MPPLSVCKYGAKNRNKSTSAEKWQVTTPAQKLRVFSSTVLELGMYDFGADIGASKGKGLYTYPYHESGRFFDKKRRPQVVFW